MPKNLLVLIDTNVWVSAFINRKGYPAKVEEAFVNHEFDIAIYPPLLQELSDVLRRPRIIDLCKITDAVWSPSRPQNYLHHDLHRQDRI